MNVKQRQQLGLVRSLGVSEETAQALVDDGLRTVADVVAADEATLLRYKIKTKVQARIAHVKTLREPLEAALTMRQAEAQE